MNVVNEETSVGMLARVVSGDANAWERFAQHCSRVILSWCRKRSFSPVDTDDVVQESMLVVLVRIHEFRRLGRGSLRAWLRAIAWRCRCDEIAKSKGQLRLQELQSRYQEATSDIEMLEQEFERLHHMDCLERCLAAVRERVQPATWLAFQKHALEKKSGPEAAAELGVSLESIYAAKHRVLRLVGIEWRRITGQQLPIRPEQENTSAH